MADKNFALATNGGVCTTSGNWLNDNPAIFNDGDRVYGRLASVGTTPWAEIAFSSSSNVTSVVANIACLSASSFSWKVHAYYGGSWNEIGSGSLSSVTQTDYTYTGTWSGVTKIKFEVISSGGTIGGSLHEFEAWGPPYRAQAPLPQWYKPA